MKYDTKLADGKALRARPDAVLEEVEIYLAERAKGTNMHTASDPDGFSLEAWVHDGFAELRKQGKK